MVDGTDSLPPGITPEVAAMIRRARADQREAARLREAIVGAGLEIEDLAVAFSGGVVALSGRARDAATRDGAADVVQRQEGVRQVSNRIAIAVR